MFLTLIKHATQTHRLPKVLINSSKIMAKTNTLYLLGCCGYSNDKRNSLWFKKQVKGHTLRESGSFSYSWQYKKHEDFLIYNPTCAITCISSNHPVRWTFQRPPSPCGVYCVCTLGSWPAAVWCWGTRVRVHWPRTPPHVSSSTWLHLSLAGGASLPKMPPSPYGYLFWICSKYQPFSMFSQLVFPPNLWSRDY